MKKKNIILCLIMLITLFSITGCGFTKKEKSSENNKYDGYELVTDLGKVDYASIEVLVMFDGVLYGKANGVIDYAGGTQKIGVIDKLIPNKYVPKLDNETNTKELLNAEVYDKSEKYIILKYDNEYVLFEKIDKLKFMSNRKIKILRE